MLTCLVVLVSRATGSVFYAWGVLVILWRFVFSTCVLTKRAFWRRSYNTKYAIYPGALAYVVSGYQLYGYLTLWECPGCLLYRRMLHINVLCLYLAVDLSCYWIILKPTLVWAARIWWHQEFRYITCLWGCVKRFATFAWMCIHVRDVSMFVTRGVVCQSSCPVTVPGRTTVINKREQLRTRLYSSIQRCSLMCPSWRWRSY